ncbi:MAG TPA: hypothetical protein PKV17_07265 [Aquabacterium sp.]|nr:hypothetical protein [Aquabacterium sp.]HRH28560.1 hypothetical protein [Aquabacterium sp.]
MATAQAQLTPTSDTTPAVVSVTSELSGPQWVPRFPTSTSVSDCEAPFDGNLQAFIDAMKSAGAAVTIAATLRPPERAYLMHWCYRIANEDHDPRTIPAKAGVNIKWDHRTGDGSYDADNSKRAARAMRDAYGMQNLQTRPALNSRHTIGLAVDMSISWSGDLTIVNADGASTTINTTPRTGMNTQLKDVGATYRVIKYVGGAADKPHWSDNGH